ncbi:HTH_Tnp_Tc3_1 domain-containing protein [Trichonephila clavipes]|nr:HTH_Tnp_Tc3_1 domain-containing protein [Trichonephila clavipes]
MAGCQDSSEFERGVIVGAQEMGHGISEGTVQAGGGSVIVWGVCSWRDLGHLICLDTTLTGDRYVSILSDLMHLLMSIVHSDGLEEFQQENATSHTSTIDIEWLQEHFSEFRHFRWPPESPDINIIEYIWDTLQHAVRKRSPPPLTPNDLWTVLQYSWCQLPPAKLQTLIESMPRHVAALLLAPGGLLGIRQVYQFFFFGSSVHYGYFSKRTKRAR